MINRFDLRQCSRMAGRLPTFMISTEVPSRLSAVTRRAELQVGRRALCQLSALNIAAIKIKVTKTVSPKSISLFLKTSNSYDL